MKRFIGVLSAFMGLIAAIPAHPAATASLNLRATVKPSMQARLFRQWGALELYNQGNETIHLAFKSAGEESKKILMAPRTRIAVNEENLAGEQYLQILAP